MAYNFQDIDPENIDFKQQSDDARKKRMLLAASLATGGDFSQALGQYATQRVDQVANTLSNPGQAVQDRLAGVQQTFENPEEALKKRLMGQTIAQQAQQPQPTGPVMPEEIAKQRTAEQIAQPAAMAQPTVPVAPVQPKFDMGEFAGVDQAVQQQQSQYQPPAMGEPVQVAGPTQLSSPTTTAAPAQAAPAQAAPATDVYHESVIAARNETDPTKRRQAYAALLANENVPEGYKTMANRFISEDYLKQREQAKAEEKIAQATPNDLARYMQAKGEDGSYLKAILFQRLGLTELAKEEQQKLGAGVKMASAVDATTGQRYTVERNANGEISRAFNTEGKKASQEEIARLSAATLPTQAHQLPSVHGSPVINAQGQTGLLMYDPQSQSSYVQAGNQRLPTTGWTTMAQNVQNVYGASQAQALGKGAGEGLTPQPMKPLPGAAAPAVGAAANQQALNRAQGDVAGADREIARLSTLPNTDPTKQQRIAIVQAEKAKAQQQVQQLSGASQGLPAGAGTQAVPGAGYTQQKANIELQTAREKEGIQVAGQRSQAFNKILDEEVRPQAQQGDTIVSTRKQQFQIFDRPGVDASKIFGIANGAGQAPGDQRWTMLRDTLLGKTTATDDQIRERAAQLGLNREEQAALAEYNIANAKINAATLKQTAGAGSVSDAEQRANREMNVDPTKIPAMGAYNAMAQSQFEGDKARYKADWASTHPATNALQLDKAWRKESQQLTEMYTDIAKQRAKFITENGATAAAVKEAYKRFPVPEYDPQTEKWKKTKPLTAYER